MIQKRLHFFQVLQRHVGLVQFHVQPRDFQNVSNEGTLADLVTTGECVVLSDRDSERIPPKALLYPFARCGCGRQSSPLRRRRPA